MMERIRTYLAKPGLGPILVKATLGSAGLRIAGMFFGFLVGVQLARGLGAEGYGIYGLAMSIVALLSVVTEFGLAQLVIREISAAQVKNEWGKVRGVLKWSSKTVLLTSFLTSIASIGWIILSGKRVGEPLPMTLLFGLLLIPVVAQGNIRNAALRGLQKIMIGQMSEVLIRPATFSILIFIAILATPLNPTISMALGVTSAGISLVFSSVMLRKSLPPEVRLAKPKIESKLWRSSALPMALSEGMRVLQAHLAVLMLGYLSTFAMVGIFRVASSVALLIAFPISLFTVIGTPLIARLYAQNDLLRLQRLLSLLSLGMTTATIALCIPFVFSGRDLLGITFGSDLSAANPILLVLSFSNLVGAVLGANAVLLNMTGNQNRVMRASWISLAIICTTCPIFIVKSGAIGAAAAFTLASTIWNIILWRDTVRLLKLNASLFRLVKNTSMA